MNRAAAQVTVRRPGPSELALVRSLVQVVVDETYGGLWAEPPLRIDEEDWSRCWIAADGTEIAGMTLTSREWVSDLWVVRSRRGEGVGTALLRAAEAEIGARGFAVGRLRLVASNAGAKAFYEKRGWLVQRSFPHEHLPVRMFEMTKHLPLAG